MEGRTRLSLYKLLQLWRQLMPNHQDGRLIARRNELRIMKALQKFAWLRTRDLAALVWTHARSGAVKDNYVPAQVVVPGSAIRMAQRTVRRLRERREIISHQAPDGSTIHALSEGGARVLRAKGIPAQSGKNHVRRFSAQQYHHRRLANEIAIGALLGGYRVTSDYETASGLWLGGMEGCGGKKPDVLVRSGAAVWWVEVERSRRNARDYNRLLEWLRDLWSDRQNIWACAPLPGGHEMRQVIFLAERPFIERLKMDLLRLGWCQELIDHRIVAMLSLYVGEARLLTMETVAGQADSAEK